MPQLCRALKAYSTGKYMQAQGRDDAEILPLFQRAVQLDPQFAFAYGEISVSYYNLSEPQLAAQYLHKEAQMQRDMGYPAAARATLDGLSAGAQAGADYAIERTLVGDIAFGERFLAEHAGDAHPSTDLQYRVLPRLRAAIATGRGRPLDAVAALEASNPYGLTDSLRLTQRAKAYLRAGRPDAAIAAFRQIADHPGFSFDVVTPLAHLGLARAYVKAADPVHARAEYEAFLGLWQNGDADLPPLKAAKAELARLPAQN